MKKLFVMIAIAFLAATTPAHAQSAPATPAFEVASIRPSQPSGADRVDAGLHMDGSQARFGSLNLKDYVAIAYRVPQSRVTGPDWISEQRFDIRAKLPDGATTQQIPEMMQSLLAQRFQLKVHRETRNLPAYALVVGKQPLKLKEAAPDTVQPGTQGNVNVAASGSAAGVSVDLGNGRSFTFANNQFVAKKISTDILASELSPYLDRPVVNMTGLKGSYDLTLDVTPDDYRILLIRSAVNAGVVLPPPALHLLEGGRPESLFDSLDQQGLHLEGRTLPLDMIVVDQALQTPTEN